MRQAKKNRACFWKQGEQASCRGAGSLRERGRKNARKKNREKSEEAVGSRGGYQEPEEKGLQVLFQG